MFNVPYSTRTNRFVIALLVLALLAMVNTSCQTPDAPGDEVADPGVADSAAGEAGDGMNADDGTKGDDPGMGDADDVADEQGAGDEAGDETGDGTAGDEDEGDRGAADDSTAPETEPVEISLDGEITNRDAEISSLAWHGDTLVLMPQYPGWSDAEGKADGVVYAIDRDEILQYLDNTDAEAITPREIAFDADGLDASIDGFEGFEALAFDGDRAYFAVEAETEAVAVDEADEGADSDDGGEGDDDSDAAPTQMFGLLVAGDMAADGSRLAVDSSVLTSVKLPVNLPNMSIETLLVGPDRLYAIFEANGSNVNEASDAASFNLDLTPGDWVDFPTIEYRVTDATALGPDGSFWITNYYWPGEAELLEPAPDAIVDRFGEGATHAANEGVERIVPMVLGADGIFVAEEPPVQLSILGDDSLRNWEGIVRLDDRGWLLATDSFPTTMLVFVPDPAAAEATDGA